MLAKLLGLPETPLVVFLVFAASATLLFGVLSGASYYLLFRRWRGTFHPGYEPDPPEIREAIKWSLIAIVGNAALITPIHTCSPRDTAGSISTWTTTDGAGWSRARGSC